MPGWFSNFVVAASQLVADKDVIVAALQVVAVMIAALVGAFASQKAVERHYDKARELDEEQKERRRNELADLLAADFTPAVQMTVSRAQSWSKEAAKGKRSSVAIIRAKDFELPPSSLLFPKLVPELTHLGGEAASVIARFQSSIAFHRSFYWETDPDRHVSANEAANAYAMLAFHGGYALRSLARIKPLHPKQQKVQKDALEVGMPHVRETICDAHSVSDVFRQPGSVGLAV